MGQNFHICLRSGPRGGGSGFFPFSTPHFVVQTVGTHSKFFWKSAPLRKTSQGCSWCTVRSNLPGYFKSAQTMTVSSIFAFLRQWLSEKIRDDCSEVKVTLPIRVSCGGGHEVTVLRQNVPSLYPRHVWSNKRETEKTKKGKNILEFCTARTWGWESRCGWHFHSWQQFHASCDFQAASCRALLPSSSQLSNTYRTPESPMVPFPHSRHKRWCQQFNYYSIWPTKRPGVPVSQIFE